MIHNLNLENPEMAVGVRVRIKEKDLPRALTIVEEMEKQRLNQKLYELMESVLSLREKEVLYLRYGLPGGTELTQKEVGKRLGISRSYVSRIEKRALLRLRDAAWG